MEKIQVIPVIDIRDGKAVEAKGDGGDVYQELRSVICDSSHPLDVANVYAGLGFKEVYVADLDGILDSKPNLDLLRDISLKTGLFVMADIGVWSGDDFIRLGEVKPVIASETFSSLNLLGLPKEFVLNIDTRDGELLSGMHLGLRDFLRIVGSSERIDEILLTDLERLGVFKGPNLGLCGYVLGELSGKTVIYGGGVRGSGDLEALAGVGINKVLVGSALHSGRIFGDPDL